VLVAKPWDSILSLWRIEATRIGAIDFLEKPIALQKLLRAVQKGLERGVGLLRAVASKPALSTFPLDHSDKGEGGNGNLGLGGSGPGSDHPSGTLLRSEMPLDLPLREARDAFERAYFEYHLSQENGSMTRVAEKTGLERTHLYRKLKQLGIELNKAGRK